MKPLVRARRHADSDAGTTAIEYALMGGVIATALIVALSKLGQVVAAMFMAAAHVFG